MSRLPTIFVDTSILPSEAFAYRDDEFYSLVDLLAGSDEVELLRIQSIRTVHSFLRIKNVFDVLDIDSEEINRIKHHICFILNDNTYIIKAGIKGSIEYTYVIFSFENKLNYQKPPKRIFQTVHNQLQYWYYQTIRILKDRQRE